MTADRHITRQDTNFNDQEGAARNERFAGECVKLLHAAPDAEEGLRRLLAFLGKTLECDRVYVFENMDRQHTRNTYEWCKSGVSSGIKELPYVSKKDLFPWYGRLAGGGNVIEPDVESLHVSDPLLYGFLQPQQIRSIVLIPLMAQGEMVGFLGADNPPPEKLAHITVLLDVLAYFVSSLVSQRELQKLRETRAAPPKRKTASPLFEGKVVLLIDDSPELLRLNERVLRPNGYTILNAGTLIEAEILLKSERPDAIVLDIDLPDGSGLDFCRKLQSRADIPVIFLTAHSDARTAREGIEAGGCAFLTKPYQLEELRDAVAKAVKS